MAVAAAVIAVVSVKKRPKVRWLFVINPRERKNEGRKEGRNHRKKLTARTQAHILHLSLPPRLDIKLEDLYFSW